eukprot:TRINITY_DN60375_c0_g1_i1.p1 TRINITY_DN60375_c0_g1~~TRINITY_DN60375_c0_g1_i1.p1  ORF type:complete len:361 (+),score=59.95 TRINITY_DN60375_c0_g1_i1:63-1145(+)
MQSVDSSINNMRSAFQELEAQSAESEVQAREMVRLERTIRMQRDAIVALEAKLEDAEEATRASNLKLSHHQQRLEQLQSWEATIQEGARRLQTAEQHAHEHDQEIITCLEEKHKQHLIRVLLEERKKYHTKLKLIKQEKAKLAEQIAQAPATSQRECAVEVEDVTTELQHEQEEHDPSCHNAELEAEMIHLQESNTTLQKELQRVTCAKQKLEGELVPLKEELLKQQENFQAHVDLEIEKAKQLMREDILNTSAEEDRERENLYKEKTQQWENGLEELKQQYSIKEEEMDKRVQGILKRAEKLVVEIEAQRSQIHDLSDLKTTQATKIAALETSVTKLQQENQSLKAQTKKKKGCCCIIS